MVRKRSRMWNVMKWTKWKHGRTKTMDVSSVGHITLFFLGRTIPDRLHPWDLYLFLALNKKFISFLFPYLPLYIAKIVS
jgi:hypothetical protein